MIRIMATTPIGINPLKFKKPLRIPPIIPPRPAAPTAPMPRSTQDRLSVSVLRQVEPDRCPQLSRASRRPEQPGVGAASAVAARLAICPG